MNGNCSSAKDVPARIASPNTASICTVSSSSHSPSWVSLSWTFGG